MDPRPLDQRHRQPGVWIPGLGIGRGIYLVGQQSAESVDRLVQRPGQRPERGSHLHPRRGHRRAVGAHSAPHPRGHLPVRRPAWPGLQPVRAHVPRHRHEPSPVRSARGPDQDLPPSTGEPLEHGPTPLDHRLCRVDAGRLAKRDRAVHRHRRRSRDGSALRP